MSKPQLPRWPVVRSKQAMDVNFLTGSGDCGPNGDCRSDGNFETSSRIGPTSWAPAIPGASSAAAQRHIQSLLFIFSPLEVAFDRSSPIRILVFLKHPVPGRA